MTEILKCPPADRSASRLEGGTQNLLPKDRHILPSSSAEVSSHNTACASSTLGSSPVPSAGDLTPPATTCCLLPSQFPSQILSLPLMIQFHLYSFNIQFLTIFFPKIPPHNQSCFSPRCPHFPLIVLQSGPLSLHCP